MTKETLIVGKETIGLEPGIEVENNESVIRMTVEDVDEKTGKVFLKVEDLVLGTEKIVSTVVGVTRLTIEMDPGL